MTQQQQLISAMLRGSDRQLYATSAGFKIAVDTLATMIPAFVDGLAESAKNSDEIMERNRRYYESHPFPPVFVTDRMLDLTKDARRDMMGNIGGPSRP